MSPGGWREWPNQDARVRVLLARLVHNAKMVCKAACLRAGSPVNILDVEQGSVATHPEAADEAPHRHPATR